VIAEYASVRQDIISGSTLDSLNNNAWEVTGSWLLTGENATHNNPVSPNMPFSSNGDGWGAWEVVTRFQETNLDKKALSYVSTTTPLSTSSITGLAARTAKTWGAGINWYLSKNLKLATNYEVTSYDKFPLQTLTRPDEKFIDSRLQLAF